MKKKIDLRKFLSNELGEGSILYSPKYGNVRLEKVSMEETEIYPIVAYSLELEGNGKCEFKYDNIIRFTRYGTLSLSHYSDVMLLPSREERDWEEYIKQYRLKQYNENMLDFFNTYCEANCKDKDSVVEAMLWMRDRIMKEMKYMVSDANFENRAIIPCCDECDAGLDVDILTEHINAEIMDMF